MATVKHPGKDAALSEGTKLERPVNNGFNATPRAFFPWAGPGALGAALNPESLGRSGGGISIRIA